MTSASNTQQTSRRLLDYLLTAAMLACFGAAGWHFAGNHVSEAAISTSSRLDENAELPKAERALKTTSIEEIRLGQRVVGRNPLRHETQSPSGITPENWRVVQLSMFAFGVEYDLQFLRSTEWLRKEQATTGGTIHLKLPEIGLDGPAEVIAINPCPPIEPDDGTGRQIVTGLMAHPAENILDITITGLDEPLGVTTTHPIWSETRQQFVKAAHLKVGEHLRSETGVLAQVTRITPHRGPPQPVYNLEVNAEHVYQVGPTGLLVHNVCPMDIAFSRPVKPGETFKHGPWEGRSVEEAIAEAKKIGDLPEGLTLNADLVNDAWVTANNRTLRVAQKAGVSQVHPKGGSKVLRQIEEHFRNNGTGGPVSP